MAEQDLSISDPNLPAGLEVSIKTTTITGSQGDTCTINSCVVDATKADLLDDQLVALFAAVSILIP